MTDNPNPNPNAAAFARFRDYLDALGAAAPVPPQDVLDRAPTYADVQRYPDYYIHGAGRAVAQATDCGHGYWLTDSCPCCGAD